MEKIQNSSELDHVFDLDGEIERCSKYLLEKQQREIDANKSQYGYGDFLAELCSVKKDIDSALKRLDRLSAHFEAGPVLTADFTKLGWSSPGGLKTLGMGVFSDHHGRLVRTRDLELNASVEMNIMISEVKILHRRKTRALDLQKSAARLAYAIVGDRIKGQARKVAIQIMDKANLGNPDKSSLTGWIKEFRKDEAEWLSVKVGL